MNRFWCEIGGFSWKRVVFHTHVYALSPEMPPGLSTVVKTYISVVYLRIPVTIKDKTSKQAKQIYLFHLGQIFNLVYSNSLSNNIDVCHDFRISD